MEESMRDSMDKLLKSNEELEQFAYVASHDLQEPLRMVASYTQLLSRRYKGKLDEDADEFISYAVDGAKRMQGLIKDLLEYSRVGSEGNQLLPINSGKVLIEVIANLSIAIEDAGISLTHDEMPSVLADELQLLQLLQNLIGNAIKYRDPEKTGEIHIGVRAEDRYWVFAVKDNGIGIEPKFFDQIFVIFKRLHAPGERSGSGIGLSICKKIIERHGGEIWVESVPGEGSTFFFKLQQYEPVRI
jgi:light-regulated signal transduction histidine kinase (bacteriophytochrome)